MNTEHHTGPGVGQAEPRLRVIEIRGRHDAIRVAVTGELDLGTTPVLHQRLSETLDGRRTRCLQLDLSALTFCDLTGLRALQALERTSAPTWPEVRIVNAGAALDLLLALCEAPTLLGYIPPAPHHNGGL